MTLVHWRYVRLKKKRSTGLVTNVNSTTRENVMFFFVALLFLRQETPVRPEYKESVHTNT